VLLLPALITLSSLLLCLNLEQECIPSKPRERIRQEKVENRLKFNLNPLLPLRVLALGFIRVSAEVLLYIPPFRPTLERPSRLPKSTQRLMHSLCKFTINRALKLC